MLRAAASAVIASLLILSTAGPARADDPVPDTTAPVVTSTGLTEGQLIHRYLKFTPVVSDDVGVQVVQVWVRGEAYTYDITQARDYVMAPLDGVADDTDVTVTVRAIDRAKNRTDLKVRVHTDLTAPTATISPAGETVIMGRSMTFTASSVSADTAYIALVRPDGRELVRATAAPWNLPLTTADLGDYMTVDITVVDRAGNRTVYQPILVIDDIAPDVGVSTLWPGTVGPGVQTVRGFLWDLYGISRAEWWIDGALRGQNPDRLDYDFGTRARTVIVELRAWDRFGNQGVQNVAVTVDVQAPTLLSSVPAANGRVRGTTLKATLNLRDQSGIPLTKAPSGDYGTQGPYTRTFKLGADGKQTLEWLVSDMWGHQRKIYQTVIVDNTGPSVGWLSPGSALVRGSKITSAVKAGDGAGVRSATLSGTKADTAAPYTASIAAGKDGRRTLTWTVVDKLGNTTVVRRTVTVDNTRAKLAFATAPKNNAKVAGTVKLTATASDKYGVAKVQLLVNGKVVATDTKAGYAFALKTGKYGKKIKVQLRAYDRAGNVTTTSVRTWYRR